MKRILSGITPSSTKGLHLGNYFGAVKSHVDFQDKGQCFYFIANNHSLNTVFHPEEVRRNTENIFVEYLAFGIDPEKTIFYVESDIPAIPYLQSILNNVVTVGELKRMHGYKDKLQKDMSQDVISNGLFNYPVLMAADILAFKTDIVPVGEDQKQHVEICQEMARTFNNRYGDVLKIPEVYIKKEVARVRGTDGERKMSKSLGNDIPIFGTEEEIKKQIMGITTDPARIRPTDPGDPAKNVCFDYLRLLEYNSQEIAAMEERYRQGTIGDVEIKKLLLQEFMTYFAPFRKRKEELLKNQNYIAELREKGAERANAIANTLIADVKKAVGLIP